jgi:hypothetical protein
MVALGPTISRLTEFHGVEPEITIKMDGWIDLKEHFTPNPTLAI